MGENVYPAQLLVIIKVSSVSEETRIYEVRTRFLNREVATSYKDCLDR